MELVDTLDLGSSAARRRGSTPLPGTSRTLDLYLSLDLDFNSSFGLTPYGDVPVLYVPGLVVANAPRNDPLSGTMLRSASYAWRSHKKRHR